MNDSSPPMRINSVNFGRPIPSCLLSYKVLSNTNSPSPPIKLLPRNSIRVRLRQSAYHSVILIVLLMERELPFLAVFLPSTISSKNGKSISQKMEFQKYPRIASLHPILLQMCYHQY